MGNLPELAVGVSALVYAASLIVWRLPVGFFRRYGWLGMMHSLSSVAVISAVGGIGIVKALISPRAESLLGINLDATFEEAFQSINMYRGAVLTHMSYLNITALSLGGITSVILLAMCVASISGVALLMLSIASYLLSAVFGLLILAQKALSAALLFSDAIAALTAVAEVAGPGMFMAGLALYALPFARKLGKTLLVLGAGLTLALPAVIVQALPSPSDVEAEIEKVNEMQAYSIALESLRGLQAGARINILDRNGTILERGGGEVFHHSRPVKYPYFKLKLEGPPGMPLAVGCGGLPPGVSCERVASAFLDYLQTPESGFIDSEDYYGPVENGYRTVLTMRELAGPAGGSNAFRKDAYTPDAWVLGMWMYLQGDDGGRDSPVKVKGLGLPEKPPPLSKYVCSDITCWEKPVEDVYLEWRKHWESYWEQAPYKKIYLYNAVQEGEGTSFIWFTQVKPGRGEPLNVFVVAPPVQTVACRASGEAYIDGNATRHTYDIVVRVGEKAITYFAYLEGTEYSVEADLPDVSIREVSFGNLTGKNVIKGGGPLKLEPTVEAVEEAPEIEVSPPAHYMEVYYPGGEVVAGHGRTCEEAYLQYLVEAVEGLALMDNSTNPYVDDYRDCYVEEIGRYSQYLNATNNEAGNYTGAELINEPTSNSTSTEIGHPPCLTSGGVVPIAVTVHFNVLKESGPYNPEGLVEWKPFEKDRECLGNLASGGYVEGELGVETHREEWSSYPIFKLGLYRDGPVHDGQRHVVQELNEYKAMAWERNAIAAEAFKIFNMAVSKASGIFSGGEAPEIPAAKALIGDGESVGMINVVKIAGYTIALAYGLLLFTISLDAVSAFVGGESVGKKLVGGAATYIYRAVGGAGGLIQAIRRGMPSILAWREAKAQQDKMLKSFIEERKRDRRYMEEMSWKRLEEVSRKKAFGRLLSLEEGARARHYEKVLDAADKLDGRGVLGGAGARLLREYSRGYASEQHAYNLMRDPEYAGKYLEQSVYVKQSIPAAMYAKEFTGGLAKMLRDAPASQRAALLDQFARESPSVGGQIMWKKLLHLLGPFSDRISAPAAFKVAYEMSKVEDPSGGRKPIMPYAYIPDFKTSMWNRQVPSFWRRAEGLEIPYIHRSEDPFKAREEAGKAVEAYSKYVRALGGEEARNLKESILRDHVEPVESPDAPPPDRNAVEVESYWMGPERGPLDAQTPLEMPSPESASSLWDVRDVSMSVEAGGVEIGDVRDGIDYSLRDVGSFHDHYAALPEDLKQSFWWLTGDIMDRLPENASMRDVLEEVAPHPGGLWAGAGQEARSGSTVDGLQWGTPQGGSLDKAAETQPAGDGSGGKVRGWWHE